MGKRLTVFGRQISALVLGLVLMGALASAGLLTYYGMAVGTASVSQSVTLSSRASDGSVITTSGNSESGASIEYYNDVVAGNSYINGKDTVGTSDTGDDVEIAYFTLDNAAGTDASVNLYTTVEDPNGDEITPGSDEAITDVKYVEYTSSEGCTSNEISSSVTVPASDQKAFCVKVSTNLAAIPGQYTITTKAQP